MRKEAILYHVQSLEHAAQERPEPERSRILARAAEYRKIYDEAVARHAKKQQMARDADGRSRREMTSEQVARLQNRSHGEPQERRESGGEERVRRALELSRKDDQRREQEKRLLQEKPAVNRIQ